MKYRKVKKITSFTSGRGIITNLKRNSGAFLLQYAGETISAAEGERRESGTPTGFRFFYKCAGKKLW